MISAENAAALRDHARGGGDACAGATGLSAQVPGYRVAGKTGTGKLVQDGQYVAGEVASFIGMAPADAPAVRDRGLRPHPGRQRRRRWPARRSRR